MHTSPPGSLCSLPLPGSRNPGTTSPGEHTVHLRLMKSHTGLCHCRLAPLSVPLPPPAWVSQSPLVSSYFKLVLYGWGTDSLRQPTRKSRPKSKAEPQELWEKKKRKGNFSQQPQEQQIKSPPSTWCTLHLWNTWTDNKSSQNWGGGLWEQI